MDEFVTSFEHGHGETEGGFRHNRRRLFTVSEANRALVLIKRIVADILCEYVLLNDLQETIEAGQESGRYDRARNACDELVESVNRIHAHVEELDEVGVDLKDWTLGVVDFRCVTDGREVALCWRAGEEEIHFWHDPGTECSTRKPLDMLSLDHPLPAGRES